MISETSLSAQQCLLRKWAEQIRDCQNCAKGISIIEQCSYMIITGSAVLGKYGFTSFQKKQQSSKLCSYRQVFVPSGKKHSSRISMRIGTIPQRDLHICGFFFHKAAGRCFGGSTQCSMTLYVLKLYILCSYTNLCSEIDNFMVVLEVQTGQFYVKKKYNLKKCPFFIIIICLSAKGYQCVMKHVG